jgi:DNA-binding CsgD family transcriptional regulator
VSRAASVEALGASGELRRVQRHLHAAATVPELLARASPAACTFCDFTRALVLTVEDGRLSADGAHAIAEPESDELRLLALGTAMPLQADSEEAELIRRAESLARCHGPLPSVVATRLGLEHYVLAPVVPESRVVALLVVDRLARPVQDRDRDAVELFAHLLGLALERTVLRARLGELSTEVRHMTTSALALLQEAVAAPVTVTTEFGGRPVFSPAVGMHASAPGPVDDLLTAREREIIEMMVQGRSNRDIADKLHLAPNTIKAQVARLLRKLGASNRAEAVGRYLTMRASGG